ncbi:MAG: 30S ribosome-binding factor RbfA [Candidatus Parabeggiatoa sp. nov. 2]|nr:MAG: ribosome-binding factor A [Beggiatoa sp. 4572_84]RKZ62424.1 MAG: 30S ribosome-binding factor RbfA [Gammaproteobacteria bacterium]HEC83915.1 30S ribosome-binding factor RbfA [Thioploca sp.]
MMKEFSRTQRVGVQIQRELADIIRREISDPGLGMLTVSSVDVSPDLKYARVYVTALGGSLSIEQTIAKLDAVAGRLRHHLSQRLTTRTTPRLQFVHDSSIEYGSRLSALIDSVAPVKECEK